MIKISNLQFAWPGSDALFNGMDLEIAPGTHVALMGSNGSGKSTLAYLVKGLLVPTGGRVVVDGFGAEEEESRYEMMKRTGLVFQNPDSSIVATTVERELAFGLENTGTPPEEMKIRVEEALEKFDLLKYRHSNPLSLSGGEKQRTAIAGVLVMKPSHLVLDEPTSLLDPWSRSHILEILHDLAEEGSTVIHITQFENEALKADRVIILDNGSVIKDGLPEEVLGKESRAVCGFDFMPPENQKEFGGDALLQLREIEYTYDKDTPFEHKALKKVNIDFKKGSSTVLLGPSGSGKTTLLEIAAGLIYPTAGQIINNHLLQAMALQFPEDQIYGDTVEEYVYFGPKNIGLPEDETKRRTASALENVGLAPDMYLLRNPETLSGGEKRRLALAGVLAMEPDLLVLDEPTAGLDSNGVKIVSSFLNGYVEQGGTLLFSTHDFGLACELADRAIVMEEGRIERVGSLSDVFKNSRWLDLLRNMT